MSVFLIKTFLVFIFLSCLSCASTQSEIQCRKCELFESCFTNITCMPNSILKQNNNGNVLCVCQDGFFLNAQNKCELCSKNFFCKSNQKFSCISNSETFFNNASSVSDCHCSKGYEQRNSECIECAAGKFKNSVGNFPCSQCTGNTITSTSGRQFCEECGAYKIADLHKTQCNCIDGFFKQNNECLRCPFAHFCADEIATKCPENMVSSEGALSIFDCKCDQGFYYNEQNSMCEACTPGKYQNQYGMNDCLQCGVGKYNLFHASKEEQSCTQCPRGKTTQHQGSNSRKDCFRDKSFVVKKTRKQKKMNLLVSMPISAAQFSEKKRNNLRKSIANAFNTLVSNIIITSIKQKQRLRRLLSSFIEIGIEINDVENNYVSEESINLNLQTLNETTVSVLNATLVEVDEEELTACGFGFYAHNNSDCVDCSPGQAISYTLSNTSDSVEDCLQCPSNSAIDENSLRNSISNCKCLAGFTSFQHSGCVACAAGKYKNSSSNDNCLPCAANTYSAEASTSCSSCPVNSYSSTASTVIEDCQCEQGFERQNNTCLQCIPGKFSTDGVLCSPCPVNKFSNVARATACAQCAFGSYTSVSSSSTCTECVQHSTYDYTKSGCSCNAGYYKEGAQCMPCLFGHFKTEVGDEQCSSCASGKSTMSKAATHASNCTLCVGNSIASNLNYSQVCMRCHNNSVAMLVSENQHSCVCEPGFFTKEFGECLQCPLGKFKDEYGNHNCSNCNPGYSTAEEGSKHDSDCKICERGKYAAKTFSHEAQICNSCFENSDSMRGSSALSDCTCNAGYAPENSLCLPCSYGQYKNSQGNEACSNCPAGYRPILSLNKTSLDNNCVKCTNNTYVHLLSNMSSSCLRCPSHSLTTTNIDRNSCQCNAGYYAEGMECKACLDGTYKDFIANSPCVMCSDSQFSSNGMQCTDCMPNSHTWKPSSTIETCICDAGYEFKNGHCDLCGTGKYRYLNYLTETNNSACIPCPQDMYYDKIGTLNDRNLCQACPANSHSASGSHTIKNCTCVSGFIKTATEHCQPCQANFFCPDQLTQSECPLYSSSEQASFDQQQCICDPGFYKEQDICMPCPVNNYCPGNDVRVQCYSNSSTMTLAQQNSAEACVCNEGFFWNSPLQKCEICPPNFFCYAENITQCPPNSTSQKGMKQCVCHSGYRNIGSNNLVHCIECSKNWICAGNNIEIQCASNAENVNNRCVCKEGTICSNLNSNCLASDSTCNTCARNFFCTNNTQSLCPANSQSEPGSASVQDCKCLSGFYRLNNECIECPFDEYCYDEQKYACASFDQHLQISYTKAQSRAECQCKAGFFRINILDSCKKCPKNFYCPTNIDLPNVRACLLNEYTLVEGSSSRSDCLCDAGHKLSSSGDVSVCLPCEEGERCVNGEVQEFQCHIFKRTPNDDHSQCVCMPGFYENEALQCVPCEDGKYKTQKGNEPCAACPAGQQAKNTTHCERCPHFKTSIAGQSCFCDTPRVLQSNGECETCKAGYYRESPTLCAQCPEFSTSVPGAASREQCTCIAGYVLQNLTCIPCDEGFYQQGNQCIQCPFNSMSAAASFLLQNCTCNATKCQIQMPDMSCKGECGKNIKNCSSCNLGWHKDIFGNAADNVTCAKCYLNTFADNIAAEECTSCHNTTTTLHDASPSHTDCLCKMGHEPDTLQSSNTQVICKPCLPGFFKADVGNHACLPCDIGSYQEKEGQPFCLSCNNDLTHANTTLNVSSIHISECVCLSGYYLLGQKCVLCSGGSFKSKKGNHACTFCSSISEDYGVSLLHTFSDSGAGQTDASVCQKCPQHSGMNPLFVANYEIVMNSIQKCQCFGGYFFNISTQQCQHCAPYQYRRDFLSFALNATNYSTDGVCQYCADDFFFVSPYQSCIKCQLQDSGGATVHSVAVNALYNATWAVDEDYCVCRIGFYRNDDTCFECSAGKYRGVLIEKQCTLCELGKYQPSSASSSCLLCPANSTHSVIGSVSNQDCLCNAGYEWNGDSCDACMPGKFKSSADKSPNERYVCEYCPQGSYSSTLAAQQCTFCASNETSLAPFDNANKCACKGGFGGDPCRECPVGYFAPERVFPETHTACTKCPAFKTTQNSASTSQAQCVCQAGYGTSDASTDSPCHICTTGTFSPGLVNAACLTCGNFTITDPENGAKSFDSCYCNHVEGFYSYD